MKIKLGPLCLLLFGLGSFQEAFSQPVELLTKHSKVVVQSGALEKTYFWLEPQAMLEFKVQGPIYLGLGMREVLPPDAPLVALDITVVKDDQEQATVHVPFPGSDGELIAKRDDLGCSGEVWLMLEIPKHKHRYRILVTGSSHGILFVLEQRSPIRDGVMVAFEGQTQRTSKPVSIHPRRIKRSWQWKTDSDEVLDAVEGFVRSRIDVRASASFWHSPKSLGPSLVTAGSLAGMMALGSFALWLSGVAQEDRARSAQIQIVAGEYHERAQHSYTAAAVMGGVALGALVTGLVLYYLVPEKN